MVLIHVKKTDDLQFLTEVPCDTPMQEVLSRAVAIWNKIIKLRRFADACEELSKHGPAKKPDEQGLDEYQEGITGRPAPARGPHYNADPVGKRTGEAPEPRMAEVIRRQVAEARSVCNVKEKVAMKALSTMESLQEAWDGLVGAVTMAFPEGLPDYDEIVAMKEDEFEAETRTAELLDPTKATMWWAGKHMTTQDKKLQDWVGKNDKTKIVAKLQKEGSGAPVREPVVDEKTQKEMMAFYYKKQEEMKKLEEEQDDAYLNSAWANPKSLKQQLHGGGGVSWKAR